MKNRPYQNTACDSVLNEFRAGIKSTLVVMPTGTGKTVVFSSLVGRARKGRVLVLAHREELINQAAKKIQAVTGEYPDIEQADRRADESVFNKSKVIVASIPTLVAGMGGATRMSRFEPGEFSFVVIDECHHVESKSWQQVVKWFQKNPELRMCGFSATPKRHDNKALGNTFESVAYEYSIQQAIADGWLVPIRQTMVEVSGLDYSSIRTTAGDLNGKDLAQVMEQEHNLHSIAMPTLEISNGRKTLVFAASVHAAERLTEVMNRHKDCARWISGKTPKDERKSILDGFAEGDFPILVNVGVLTEGFDEPGIQCIVLARPTKSPALWQQMVGRGTRTLPGTVDSPTLCDSPEARSEAIAQSSKPYVEIIDFAGNAGRHKLLSAFDLLGGKYPNEVVERAKEKAKKAGGAVDVEEVLEKTQEEIEAEREEERNQRLAERARIKASVKYKTKNIDPFNALDIHKPIFDVTGYTPVPTERQQQMLLKQGIDPSGMSRDDAQRLILEIITRYTDGKCTFKQATVLKKYGYSTDVKKEEATQIIDRIAANGWRKPDD